MKSNINSKQGYKFLRISQIYCVLGLLVISSVYSCKRGNNEQEKMQTNDTLTANRDAMESQLSQTKFQLDQFMTKIAGLDTELKEKDNEIAAKNIEISKLSKEKKSIERKYASEEKSNRNTIASLREKGKSYEDRIAALENDKSQALTDRDNLQRRYNELKELGSVLTASNIRLEAIHIKHSGKEKRTARARRVNELMVRFDIDKNRVTDDGTKKLYIAIKDPNGLMLESNAEGSGTFNSHNGRAMNYSVEKDVDIKQNEAVKSIRVGWKQDKGYKKGFYDVAIYNGGYEIGEGTVALK